MKPPFGYDNAPELQPFADGGGETARGVAVVVPGGKESAERLAKAGIVTVRDLIVRCGDPREREEVAVTTGIAVEHLLEWASTAELLRISGVTPELALMLGAAGAGSLRMLRERQADRLADALLALTSERNMTVLVPSAAVVGGWIRQAGRLTSVVIESSLSTRSPRST